MLPRSCDPPKPVYAVALRCPIGFNTFLNQLDFLSDFQRSDDPRVSVPVPLLRFLGSVLSCWSCSGRRVVGASPATCPTSLTTSWDLADQEKRCKASSLSGKFRQEMWMKFGVRISASKAFRDKDSCGGSGIMSGSARLHVQVTQHLALPDLSQSWKTWTLGETTLPCSGIW